MWPLKHSSIRLSYLCHRITFARSSNGLATEVTVPDKNVTVTADVQTHTGQAWDKSDYRLARFNVAPKLVNPNFAIDLIAKVPTALVNSRVVSCDGGGGSLGHPKVYINLDKPGSHACGYCGLRFAKTGNEAEESHIQV